MRSRIMKHYLSDAYGYQSGMRASLPFVYALHEERGGSQHPFTAQDLLVGLG